jgi:hypothetical protein
MQDTFSLTSIKEEDKRMRKNSSVKFPNIKSQISLRKASKSIKDLMTPSTSRSVAKRNSQSSMLQEFFKTINDRASK